MGISADTVLRGQMLPKSLCLVDLVRNLWKSVSLVYEFESLVLDRNLLQTSPVFVKELTMGIQKIRE